MAGGTGEDIESVIAALADLNIDGLRIEWERRLKTEPPILQSGDLLRRLLVERLQQMAFGRDLDLERRLAKLVRGYRIGGSPTPRRSTFKAGSLLVRQYDGATYRIEVLANGFRWEGKTYKSLSQIARAITGVRWNGPRFFGLREKAAA